MQSNCLMYPSLCILLDSIYAVLILSPPMHTVHKSVLYIPLVRSTDLVSLQDTN